MAIPIITQEDFEMLVLSEKKPVVVDFFTSTCVPCRTLEPVLEELAQECSLKIYKIHAKENRELAKKYTVISVPTLLLFQNGEVIDFSVGYKTKEQLISWIQQ